MFYSLGFNLITQYAQQTKAHVFLTNFVLFVNYYYICFLFDKEKNYYINIFCC